MIPKEAIICIFPSTSGATAPRAPSPLCLWNATLAFSMEGYVEDFILFYKEKKKHLPNGVRGEFNIYLVIQNTYQSLDLHS